MSSLSSILSSAFSLSTSLLSSPLSFNPAIIVEEALDESLLAVEIDSILESLSLNSLLLLWRKVSPGDYFFCSHNVHCVNNFIRHWLWCLIPLEKV